MARSRNHSCRGSATLRSVCIVELRVTGSGVSALRFTARLFYGEFVSPAKNKNVLTPWP